MKFYKQIIKENIEEVADRVQCDYCKKYIGRKIGSIGFIISLFGAVFLWKEIYFPLIMGLTVINIGIIYSAFEEKEKVKNDRKI